MTDGGPGASRVAELAHGGVTWVLAERPGPVEVEELAARFGLHPLDVEQLARPGGRPKLAVRGRYTAAVLDFPVQLARPRRSALAQLSLLVGADFVLAVHGAELRPPVHLMGDLRADPARRAAEMATPGRLAYAIVRGLVEASGPLVARLGSAVDGLQEDVLAEVPGESTRQLAQLRRELIGLGRALRPDVEVLFGMARAEYTATGELPAYWELLGDGLQRQVDQVEDAWHALEALVETAQALGGERGEQRLRALLLLMAVVTPVVVVGVVASLAGRALEATWDEVAAFALMLVGILGLVRWLRSRKLV